MERIIRDEIMNFLSAYNLIIKQQHGFVNNKNCTTNLLESMDFYNESISRRL